METEDFDGGDPPVIVDNDGGDPPVVTQETRDFDVGNGVGMEIPEHYAVIAEP